MNYFFLKIPKNKDFVVQRFNGFIIKYDTLAVAC